MRHGAEEFRIWVVAAALYAVLLHALSMSAMGGTIPLAAEPILSQHAVHGEGAGSGSGHASEDHIQCCVLCGTVNCAAASDRVLPGPATILARALRPTRTLVARRRRIEGEPRHARGPPSSA